MQVIHRSDYKELQEGHATLGWIHGKKRVDSRLQTYTHRGKQTTTAYRATTHTRNTILGVIANTPHTEIRRVL